MRRMLLCSAGGLLAPLVGLTLARGSELGASDPKGGPPLQPKPFVELIDKSKCEGTCGKHGTAVEFVASPSDAAAKAKKEEKLVFVLHVSGLFEDPTLT